MHLLIDIELLDFRSEDSINILQSLLVLLIIILQDIHLRISLFFMDKRLTSSRKINKWILLLLLAIYDFCCVILFFDCVFYLIIMLFIQQAELLDSPGIL